MGKDKSASLDAPAWMGHAAKRVKEYLPSSSGSFRLEVDGQLPAGTFAISRGGDGLVFSGDCPRTVLAGTLYYIHHEKLGHKPELPLVRTSPFAHRLVMEDFPFMCYWPTGYDFSLETYAENLVALGFTAMECNRFSRKQPMETFHRNYEFTNPSPASFVWTPWHEGVWDKELIEANAAELRAVVDVVVKYGLTPTLTTFLPRPYSSAFFERHPSLKGEKFQNEHMLKTGHPPLYRLNTDHPEVREFYRAVYAALFDRFPEIGNLFFWHGDLGSGFSRNRENGQGLVQRMSGFHRMIQSLLAERGMQAKVWLNPWHLGEEEFRELDILPKEVGFSVKDNVGISIMAGSTPVVLPDATIITAEIGLVPKRVVALAEKTGRQVCMAQYQDFSEDLDPVVAVPHPIMTFRKLEKLLETSPDYSSVNWGIISPDVVASNMNQNVIREFTWGERPADFKGMLARLLPSSFTEEQTASVHEAWVCVDEALKSWPQFWGLRLQDSGMRLRWLVKPFGFDEGGDTEELFSFWLDRQIYRDKAPSPLKAFMDITPSQAVEISSLYADMGGLVSRACGLLQEVGSGWVDTQINSLRTLELFWTTYRNLFGFWGHRLSGAPEKCSGFVRAELQNLGETIDHLSAHPETIVIARNGAWGQCFGPDYLEEFKQKQRVMGKPPFPVLS